MAVMPVCSSMKQQQKFKIVHVVGMPVTVQGKIKSNTRLRKAA
jgi:precorrin isomerase